MEKQAGDLGYVIAELADNSWCVLRDECAKARIHTSTKAGISGGRDGAYSIVMSGGYSDDVDKGDTMCVSDRCFLDHVVSPAVHRVYTGTGGRDDENSRYGGGNNRSWGGGEQTKDQTFEHKDNRALLVRSQSGGWYRSEYRPAVLRTGQTRPGHSGTSTEFEIRSLGRVCDRQFTTDGCCVN